MKLIYNSIIFIGLVFLLVYPPVAYGGFSLGSRTLFQLVTLFLIVILLLNEIKQGRFPVPGRALSWLLAILCGYLMASAAFSAYPHRSWMELANVFSYVAIFILLISHFQSGKQIRTLLWILALLGSILTLYGFAILFLGIPTIFQQIPVHNISHLGGTFPNYNHFATYLGMIIPLTLSLWWMERAPVRPFISLLILIMVVGMFFTLSRGGILSFVIGMALYVWLLRHRVSKKLNWWVISILMVIFLIIAGWLVLEPFIQRWISSGGKTAGDRIILWKSTLVAFSHRPIFGYGLGTFRTVIPEFALNKATSLQRHALNDYLEMLSEVGMVGGLLVLSVFSSMVHSVVKGLKVNLDSKISAIILGAGVGAFIALVNAVFNFPLHIPSLAITLAFCLAVPVTLTTSKDFFKSISIPQNRRLRIEIQCAVVLVGVFIGIQIVRPYIPERKMDAIHYAQKIDDPGLMLRLTKKAVKWDPKNAEIHDLLGSAYRLKAVAEGLFARIESRPSSGFYESTEARDWRRIPNIPRQLQALTSFDKAIELCPYDDSFLRHRGEILLEMGKNSEALSAFQRAESLNPFDIRSHLLLMQTMVTMGDSTSAIEEYKGLLVNPDFNELQILEHAIRTLGDVNLIMSIMGGESTEKQLQVAKALERSGRWEASRALYEYLWTESGDSLALETLVASLNRHGEFDRTVTVLEKHLLSEPDDWNSWEKLANAYQRTGRFEDASKIYTKLWMRFPDKLKYGISLGNILTKTMRYDSAVVVFKDMLRMQPNNSDALLGIGKCLYYKKDYMGAITIFQNLLILNPNLFEARLHLALSYRRQGMLTQAVEQMKRCLELQPGNTQVQGYLNVLYYELGLDKRDKK